METDYTFPCGCKFKILDPTIKEEDGLPSLDVDLEKINYHCPDTWKLYAEGRTKGVFQLEKSLGQHWSKKVMPFGIEEAADVISILRPGTLKAKLDGKSMTQHYVDRKHGEEEFKYFHPDAESILKDTFGIIVYQEQAMAIARYYAGFNLNEADDLRRAMGKKKPEVMAEVKVKFIDGCKKVGILTDEEAKEVFDIIEKSNRYSFVSSHAVGYAVTGYWIAWLKTHFPLAFYTSSLIYAQDKMKPREEIKELILDSRHFGIEILSPDIKAKEPFYHLDKGRIRVGIGDIKDVGESKVDKFFVAVEEAEKLLGKSIEKFSYYEVLMNVLPNIDKTTASNMIQAGAMSGYGFSRRQMLFEYKKMSTLTSREIKWVLEQKFTNLIDAFKGLSQSKVPNKSRVVKILDTLSILQNPPEELKDTSDFIAGVEEDLIGISVVCSKLDNCDTNSVTCTCNSFSTGNGEKGLTFAVQIDRINEWFPKEGGQPLAFLTVHDSSGSLDCTVLSNAYKESGAVLFKGNTVLLSGYRSKKGTLNVTKATQI